MLIDFENTGYIKDCSQPMVEEQCAYIPSSTWGFIRGDISEQKDLIKLLGNIESGLTPEQIKLLVDADSRFEDVEKSVLVLGDNTEARYNEITQTLELKANADSVYTKSEIDTALGNIEVDLTGYATESWVKQQNYLTEHQSLAGLATESWVKQQGYLTKHQSLAGYATEQWVTEQGYLTEHQSLANYYTKSEVDTAIENVEVDLTGYATENWVYGLIGNIESGLTPEQIKLLVDADSRVKDVENGLTELDAKTTNEYVEINLLLDTKADVADVYTKSEIDNKGYLTEHQSLADYYTKSEVDTAIENVEVDLTGYATEQWVIEQGYLTEHQSLAGLASESWVNNQLILKANADSVYTKSEIDNKGYLTEHQSLADYYTKNEVDIAIENAEVDLTGYATERWVTEQGYLTEHQSLADYYTKSEVDTALGNKVDTDDFWTGTQAQWDALTAEQQNSYIIAMVEL